jgi:hypothetical protein
LGELKSQGGKKQSQQDEKRNKEKKKREWMGGWKKEYQSKVKIR